MPAVPLPYRRARVPGPARSGRSGLVPPTAWTAAAERLTVHYAPVIWYDLADDEDGALRPKGASTSPSRSGPFLPLGAVAAVLPLGAVAAVLVVDVCAVATQASR